MDRAYVDTVRLLLETAPILFRTPLFIMKGGTAINLCIQEMPRLSVDIDVVYDDHLASRADALAAISEALQLTREQLEHRGLKVRTAANDRSEESKLFVQGGRSQVKIEVNHVFRGTLLPKQ
jgi:predicted nucleotidyltransferase component of viral defense system